MSFSTGQMAILGLTICIGADGISQPRTIDHISETWPNDADQGLLGSGGLVVKVSSDWHFDVQDAVTEAEDRLLVDTLRRLAGISKVTPTLREVRRLLVAEDIERDAHTETVIRSYGTRYRQHAYVSVDLSRLAHWEQQLSRDRLRQRSSRGLRAGWFVLSTVLCVWVALRLDRRTRGYRRLGIGLGMTAVWATNLLMLLL